MTSEFLVCGTCYAKETRRGGREMINKIMEGIENTKARSAWKRGVKEYALELVEQLKENIDGGYLDPEDLNSPKLLHKALLNGADNWTQYSWGGCSLIYDCEIAKRLCNPTELKRSRNGERRPNACEEWLDTQDRALCQAELLIKDIIREANQ